MCWMGEPSSFRGLPPNWRWLGKWTGCSGVGARVLLLEHTSMPEGFLTVRIILMVAIVVHLSIAVGVSQRRVRVWRRSG